MSYISERLGISAGDRVLLLNAPRGYLGTISPIPTDVTVTGDPEQGPFDIVQVFVQHRERLDTVIADAVAAAAESRRLWATIPRAESGLKADVKQPEIEAHLEAEGWVQKIILTIDSQWYGVMFRPS